MPRDDIALVIGREAEFKELCDAFADVQSGRGRLFLISGEPGIGKTTLADTLAVHAAALGAAVLWGRCWDGGNAPAYWPWIQVFRSIARQVEGQELQTLVSGVDPSQVVPDVCESLGLKGETHSVSPIDPELERFRSFDSTLDILRQFSRARPTLLIVDDLHAADAASLLMLRMLARELRDSQLMVVATLREVEIRQSPERATLIAELGREGKTLRLAGFTESEIAKFVASVAGTEPGPAMVGDLRKTTGGNPFFLSEILRLLMSGDRISGNSRLTLRGLDLPDGSTGSIRRRLELLPARAQETLKVASVVGREFDLDLLSRSSRLPKQELVEVADRAVVGGLLTVVEEGRHYAFAHDLIRETIYREISRAERVELHRAIALAITLLYPSVPDSRIAELAYHSCESMPGGDVEQAIGYAQRAARVAQSQLAYEEAARMLEMALQVVTLWSPTNDQVRCDLMLDLADALNRSGLFAEARTVGLEAFELARRLDSATRIARAALEAGHRNSDSSVVDWELVRNLELANRKLGEEECSIKSQVLGRLAHELYWAGQPEKVISFSRESVRIARRLSDPVALMRALRAKHESLWGPDNPEERLTDATEALALAEGLHEWDFALEISYSRIGDLLELAMIDDVDREMANYRRIAEQHGGRAIRVGELRAMRILLEGRLKEAEEAITAALIEGQRMQRPATLISYAAQIGLLRYEQGRLPELEQSTKQLIEQYPNLRVARLGLLHSYVQSGRVSAARAELDSLAATGYSSIPKDFNWLAAMCSFSDAAWWVEHRATAEQLYPTLLPYADRNAVMGGDVACYGPVARFLGQLATMLGKFDEAESHFERAIAIDRKLGAPGLLAAAQHSRARMLVARGTPEAAAEARALLREVIAQTQELGFEMIHARAVELARELQRTESHSELTVPLSITHLFRQEGDYWTLSYQGKTRRLKDAKGLHYIAHLLGHPGEEIRALDLVARISGRGEEVVDAASAEDLARSGGLTGDLGHAGEMLDAQAKAAYKRRLQEIEDELEEARELGNEDRIAEAEDEKEALAHELRRAIGLGGRDRRAASGTERARVAVTRAIRLALERISEQDRELGRLLSTTIKTGKVCSYLPDDRFPVSWQL